MELLTKEQIDEVYTRLVKEHGVHAFIVGLIFEQSKMAINLTSENESLIAEDNNKALVQRIAENERLKESLDYIGDEPNRAGANISVIFHENERLKAKLVEIKSWSINNYIFSNDQLPSCAMRNGYRVAMDDVYKLLKGGAKE
jgi:hypothetical protein